MSDETFRPRRPNQTGESNTTNQENIPLSNPLDSVNQVRQQVNEGNNPNDMPGGGAFNIQGNVPPAFAAAIQAAKSGQQPQSQPQSQPKRGLNMSAGGESTAYQQAPASSLSNSTASGHLKELLEGLRGSTTIYEELQLPSKGRFYDGTDGPINGVVSIRPMTGEEEQILATPRFVKKGQAINMIFQKCLKEGFRAENLLTIDRTYLLIYLRGISYGPNYDVEIKCPECETKFSTSIDLNSLYVEYTPDEYGPTLQDVLPNTKLPFSYRLSTGKDEQEIQDHRDRRIKAFGDNGTDDSLTYRTAQLLNDIDGIDSKTELQILLKNLPINDVSYIRNCINEPPFGVDTNTEIVCPSCLSEFSLDLPLEANFFFPRRKKAKTQV
jgi:hypothetical protein